MDTQLTTQDVSLQRSKKPEPRLPRKALLDVLDDRAKVDELISWRPYTFIRITSWYNNQEYKGIGFSKVCYPDAWDAETGADIAKRHACINILHQVRFKEGCIKIYNPE